MSRTSPTAARPRLWTSFFILLTVANFGLAIIFYLLTSTLSRWSETSLGSSAAAAGLVGTAWFVGAMLGRLLMGWAEAWLGERRVMVASLAGMALGTLLYPLIGSVGPLLALRLVHGIVFGLAATALAGATLARVPASRRGEGSGWFTFGLALATGLGPFLGTLLTGSRSGQPAVFAVAIGYGVLSLVLGTVAARQLTPRPGPGAPLSWGQLVTPAVIPIGLVIAPCAIPFGAILTLLPAFAVDMGLEGPAALYFLLYAAVIVVSRPAAGVLQDRLGDMSIMVPIIVFLLAGVVMTATATNGFTLLAGGALLGLGYGTLVPAGQTVAINLVGTSRASTGVASYFLLVDLGTGLGPFVIGTLATVLGSRGALLAGAGLAVVGLVGMVLLKRRSGARRPAVELPGH